MQRPGESPGALRNPAQQQGDQPMTLQAFIDVHNLGFTYAKTDANPHMPDFEGDHYIVGFTKVNNARGKEESQLDDLFTIHYSKGLGHEGTPPAPVEVLECIMMDALMIDTAPTFGDWASELGYDSDSREAERVFNLCKSQNVRLKAFLGADLYDALLETSEDDEPEAA